MLGNLLDFAGSLISRSQSSKNASRLRRQQQGQFDAQMDQTIQRRVKDAQAAGIHPLFALGASAGASPTLTGGGPTGSGVGDAVSRIGARIAAAEIRAKEASANQSDAEADLANSKTATITQRLAASGRDGAQVTTYPSGGGVVHESPITEPIVYGPPEFYNPPVPVSQSRGLRAGNIPEKVSITTEDGRTIRVVSPDLNLEELSQPATIEYARSKGKFWLTDRLVDMAAAWEALDSPSARAIENMERQLAAVRDNPAQYQRTIAYWRGIYRRIAKLSRRR